MAVRFIPVRSMALSTETAVAADVAAQTPVAPTGNPALLGLPTFLPSGITLGLWLVGYLDTATNAGGMIPALFFSAGLFLLISAVWASRIGQSAVAGIFGTFSAFWLSFAVLLLAILNGWLGISKDATVAAGQIQNIQAAYVISFMLVFFLLTMATLRLPMAFTLGFALVTATFAFVLAFVLTGAKLWATVGGITCFGFCAVFAYIFFDAMTQELGGKAHSLGAPMQR